MIQVESWGTMVKVVKLCNTIGKKRNKIHINFCLLPNKGGIYFVHVAGYYCIMLPSFTYKWNQRGTTSAVNHEHSKGIT